MLMRIAINFVVVFVAANTRVAASAEGPLNASAACAALQEVIAQRDSLPADGPVGMGWFCDTSTLSDDHWYVIALRSKRECGGICSNLMGWYAVDRLSGAIHDYDVANLAVGRELR